MPFALRVDQSEGYDDAAMSSWLSANCSNFLGTEEQEGANLHLHFFLHSQKKLQALRAALKARCSWLVGNGSYSLKPCDDDYEPYINYICKGADEESLPEVKFKQGLEYTEEYIAARHAAYWLKAVELARSSKKRASMSLLGNVVEQVEAVAKQKKLKGHEREDIAKIYINMCISAKKPINSFYAKSVVNTVSCLLEGDQIDILATEIASHR